MSTIHDVAKDAGVSISTVSRVLNNSPSVNTEIRKRVEASIESLCYQPNAAARSLRNNRSRLIGLLISDIQNPFFMELIRGVEDEALRHDYSVILCNSSENTQKEQEYLDVLYAERVAGVLIVPTRERLGEGTLKRFRERHIPIVSVDRRLKDKDIDAVLVDSMSGAYEAVSHLLRNGYRRIGIVSGPSTVSTGRDRLEGYRQALQDASITHDPALERTGTFRAESGRELAGQLLDARIGVDALFTCNNLMTMGALEAVHERHLDVPNDIGMVGYDDMQWAEFSSIALTTIMQPVHELGVTATARLFQHLQNPGLQSRQEIVLAPNLRVRSSSQPRPGILQTLAKGD